MRSTLTVGNPGVIKSFHHTEIFSAATACTVFKHNVGEALFKPAEYAVNRIEMSDRGAFLYSVTGIAHAEIVLIIDVTVNP